MAPLARASTPARTGLVGHPSDGYGGAALSVTVANFTAEVTVQPAEHNDIGVPLIAAAVARFERECAPLPRPVAIRHRSAIPRELGLGGSSAIVISTLRALSQLAGVELERDCLAVLALESETEELGITAELPDRVVQAYGGLVFMDFEREFYEPLDTALLPPLFIAYLPFSGGSSSVAHAAVRARLEAGEPRVLAAMRTLRELAHDARAALIAGDRDAFAAALDAGYDVRASIFELDPRHTAMIDHARALGLSATYTGSGGAIVGIASDRDRVFELRLRLQPSVANVVDARH